MRIPRLPIGLLWILLMLTSVHYVVAADADYEIGPGDVLKISVYDHPDLETISRVDNEGHITFPLAGQVKFGGLTTTQAARALADKLDGEYIINPQISIFVEEFRSKKVMIIGEVVRPGLYELSRPTTLLELISRAGGLSNNAGQRATIRRATGEIGGAASDTNVSVKDLLDPGLDAVDIPLMDGDTINVLKAGVVYVTGQVNRPAAYPLETETTVIKAITMAGGFSPIAAQNKIKIIRKVNGVEKTMERVSLHEPLMANDIMVVPESFF